MGCKVNTRKQSKMKEINLLKNYPVTKRNLTEAAIERTDEV